MFEPPKPPLAAADAFDAPVPGWIERSIPLSRALLRDEVYTQIRTAIVEGQLAPGVRLRDKDLAENLGVSRMPVREAIRRLQDEGLVVAEASRWTKVAPIDTRVADEVCIRSSGPWNGWRSFWVTPGHPSDWRSVRHQ